MTTESVVAHTLVPIVTYIVNPALDLLAGLAVLIFIWGVAQMILNGDEDADARATAQRHILWGVVGLFIMIAVFGIIRVVANTLGVQVPFL